jgi:ubiquinone/menaquinone biosynthesis C-methylase UbiE
MGSQKIQGELWGKRSKDWASVQEAMGNAGYEYALQYLNIEPGNVLLDIGCGSGIFSNLAFQKGAEVTGIDASEPQIEQAQERNASIKFLQGDMEELPFADNTYDVVCGFNSFQYAADTKNALLEAKRVLKNNGKLVVMIWGNEEDCEAVTYMQAVGSLLPTPPSGSPGPFAFSENQLLERILEDIGFRIINNNDVTSIWDYPNVDTALKGLLSSGQTAKAIDINGFEKVYETIAEAIKPYTQQNGHIVYKNKFRVVISEKQKS